MQRRPNIAPTASCYCKKPVCVRYTVTQFARESVGLCPVSWFVREGIRVRLGNLDLDFKIRISDFNAEITIVWISFIPFDWEIRERI